MPDPECYFFLKKIPLKIRLKRFDVLITFGTEGNAVRPHMSFLFAIVKAVKV